MTYSAAIFLWAFICFGQRPIITVLSEIGRGLAFAKNSVFQMAPILKNVYLYLEF